MDYPTETAYALSHRPDLLALRQLIEAAKQDSEIVHAGYMPRIAFQADGQYIPQSSIQKSGTVVQAGNSTELTQVLFGPGYTWVPVDGGAIHGRAQQVDAGRDAYEIDLKRLEQDVPRQLKQVEAGLARAASALQGTEQNIALADRNLRQVEAQVQNGDLPQLDFLNAQSNLLQARFNRLNALLQNNIAIAQYDVITGRTLQFAEAPSPSAP
ncbi:MAG: TolC family protein [Verrucomicrobium sp.]|nr:TolC family protein [Verrucomicrobium sp.]